MYFTFCVNKTDEDYINFNVFHYKKTPDGKKCVNRTRLNFLLIEVMMFVLTIVLRPDIYLTTGFIFILAVIYVVFLVRSEKQAESITKKALRKSEKKGTKPYTSQAEMEFYEECFTEMADGIKTEVVYSSINTVRILNGQYIFIYLNESSAFIIPFRVFESNEQCTAFIDFLRSKISNVTFY